MKILEKENIHGIDVYYIQLDGKIGYIYIKDDVVSSVFINKTEGDIKQAIWSLGANACEKITGSGFNYKMDEVKYHE